MKRRDESGVVAIEAAIVVTIVTMLISVMLYICMVLYQQSVVTIMANQTASNIAQIYSNTSKDAFSGYVDVNGVNETVTYANIKNKAYTDVVKQKANAAALYRLKSSRILNTGVSDVKVEIVPKTNELLKDQIVVTVSEQYQIPLVSFFDVDNNLLTFTATGRADCSDLLDYLVGVPALGTSDGNAVAFTEGECIVNFYKHLSDSRPYKSLTVLWGNTVNSSNQYTHSVMPSKPKQDKMRFIKWMTLDGKLFTENTTVEEGISVLNVYGNWECTVTFDPDGGTVNPTSKVATVYKDIDLPQATRPGCTFAGWYTKKNGEGECFTGSNVQGDITVYAKWLCTVSFNPDGGQVSIGSYDVVYGKSLAQSGYSLPTPTRNGCTFNGWYTNQFGEGTQYSNNTAIKGHVNLVAKWVCNIRFMNSDYESVLPTKTVVAGKSCTLPIPDRAHDGNKGWQFLGWKDSNGISYNNSSIIVATVDLFEHWSCSHVYVYDRTVSAATCVSDGLCIHKCKYCGHEIEEILKNFGGHVKGPGVTTEPGCTKRKVVEYYCTKCGQLMDREVGSVLGHDYTGHCGQRHPINDYWSNSEDHPISSGAARHYVRWASCIVCTRCGNIGNRQILCGTHWEESGTVGWGQWNTFVEVHGAYDLPEPKKNKPK